MKKIISAIALLAAAFTASADPIGYPGSNWSTITINPGVVRGTAEDNNVLLQGKAEQGIDWLRFGAGDAWKLNTYAQVGYSVDRNKLDYNNKLVPAVGVKMVRSFEHGTAELGIQVVHEDHFRLSGPGRSGNGVQAYGSYWFGWNLK